MTRVALLAIVSLCLFGCDNLGVIAGNDSEQEQDRAANPAPPAEAGEEGSDEDDQGQQQAPGPPQENPDASGNPPDVDPPVPDTDTDAPAPGDSDEDSPDDPVNDSETPPDDVVSPDPAISPTLITDNVFLPYTEEVAWHYDNSDVVTLGPAREFAGKQIRPLRHSLDIQVFGDEFFYVGEGRIFYGGVNINAEDIPNLGTAEARIEFSSLRLVYDQYTDTGSNVILKRGTLASEPEFRNISIIYNWRSQVMGKELVDTVQYGPIPAVAIDLTLAVQVPYRVTLKTGIWFSPGLGIVARELAGLKTRLDYVEGLEPPLVFVFDQGKDQAQPAQQLLYRGVPITDNSLQVQVAYLTDNESWLKVSFDGTGSWQASFQGPALPAGLHVAQVHFTKDGQRETVLVSVLVQ